MPNDRPTAAAVHALRRDPEQVGMGFVARHLEGQFSAARSAPPVPKWATPRSFDPLAQIINSNSENEQ